MAQTYLLDQQRDVYAAYSLRKLSSSYDGPVLRVRRSSDDAEEDFGFGADGFLDVDAVRAFVGSGDGFVTAWYDQTGGEAMVNDDPTRQPYVVRAGEVVLTETGRPAVYFIDDDDSATGVGTYLLTPDRSKSGSLTNYTLCAVVQRTGGSREQDYAGVDRRGRPHEGAWYRGKHSYLNTNAVKLLPDGIVETLFRPVVMRNRGDVAEIWQGNEKLREKTVSQEPDLGTDGEFDRVGAGNTKGFTGLLAEIIVHNSYGSDTRPLDYYEDAIASWGGGPAVWNNNSLLPQLFNYQVTLYNWLKKVSLKDVTLPMGQVFTFDGAIVSDDELADVWKEVLVASTSRVVRGEPEWYVLDAGNGKGIEATGEVRIWHEPGKGYGGNPPRSWSNEPAYLYRLNIPLAGGGQGNPYYRHPALAYRALVVAMVDMMMYHKGLIEGGTETWGDMYGKAFLGWAETYRWTKEILPAEVQAAFEEGMGYFLDFAVTSDEASPRAVNTNMDMFFIHGVAEFYMATNNPDLKARCVAAAKDWLLGYPDGEVEKKHKVFALDGSSPRGGVFSPSGFIMEGDQPEYFYLGESLYHITGALAAVMDRKTGAVPADWAFIKEVVRRIEEWRLYQYWPEPGLASKEVGGVRPAHYYHGGAGYSGRTGAGAPDGQASGAKYKVIADLFPELAYDGIYKSEHKASLPDRAKMIKEINEALANRTAEMQAVYEGTPKPWSGWSPWTKETEYLPAEGWYTRLKRREGDPSSYPPAGRRGYYYNKAFGGPPVGYEFWAYKNTDGQREWGFFMEAMPHQGPYNGWYGGKIETFWTEKTGVVLITRHGKSGCDGNKEDSTCWDNLDYRAAHHVWGRDEKGKGFTTLLLRGYHLQRTSVFDLNSPTPNVTVTNVFNDPSVKPTSSKSGEETGSELEGAVQIANKVEALANGVRVTHTITSDGTDEITELWASIPVFLRLNNPLRVGANRQEDLADTVIEYWDGSAWKPMPEDRNGDGVPEVVTTAKLRLGRDFLLGEGMQYVYVGFEAPQQVRLSTKIYFDPYQTKTSVRTVHFDLHGNPGKVIRMPKEKRMRYTITTTEPDGAPLGQAIYRTQQVALEQGWNTVSLRVKPDNLALEAVLADVLDKIRLVQNNTGQIYFPEFGINDIGTWDPLEAYEINAKEAAALTVSGVPLKPAQTPIQLEKGWNRVPYLPETPRSIGEALASIADQLVVVIDHLGRVYYPEFGIDDIGTLEPGRGYRMFVSAPAVLTYPPDP